MNPDALLESTRSLLVSARRRSGDPDRLPLRALRCCTCEKRGRDPEITFSTNSRLHRTRHRVRGVGVAVRRLPSRAGRWHIPRRWRVSRDGKGARHRSGLSHREPARTARADQVSILVSVAVVARVANLFNLPPESPMAPDRAVLARRSPGSFSRGDSCAALAPRRQLRLPQLR